MIRPGVRVLERGVVPGRIAGGLVCLPGVGGFGLVVLCGVGRTTGGWASG